MVAELELVNYVGGAVGRSPSGEAQPTAVCAATAWEGPAQKCAQGPKICERQGERVRCCSHGWPRRVKDGDVMFVGH